MKKAVVAFVAIMVIANITFVLLALPTSDLSTPDTGDGSRLTYYTTFNQTTYGVIVVFNNVPNAAEVVIAFAISKDTSMGIWSIHPIQNSSDTGNVLVATGTFNASLPYVLHVGSSHFDGGRLVLAFRPWVHFQYLRAEDQLSSLVLAIVGLVALAVVIGGLVTWKLIRR